MESHHYGYSIHPRTNANELSVIVNNGQTLVEAIKENIKEDTSIVFLQDEQESFCKALHQYLGFGELKEDQIFDWNESEKLQDFLETKIGTNNHFLVIDLQKYARDFYQKLPSECQLFITYFKCPLFSWSDRKILDIMEENPNLYESCFEGKSPIQDDPLNIVAIFGKLSLKIHR